MTLLDLPQVPLTLTLAQNDGGDVLTVIGYVDSFTVPTIQPVLLAAADRRDHPKAGGLTLDLSCVRYIDRAGLEMLLQMRETVADQECDLVIRLRPGSQPETMLRDLKIDCHLTWLA